MGNDNVDDVGDDDDDDDEFVKHKIKSQMCHNIEPTLKVYSFCANVCFINCYIFTCAAAARNAIEQEVNNNSKSDISFPS